MQLELESKESTMDDWPVNPSRGSKARMRLRRGRDELEEFLPSVILC